MATRIPKSPLHAHYASPIFKIIAGPEGDEYNVHSRLLADKSPMLGAIVDGKWKESSERVIRWEEWDSAAVSMFIEWVYTAEYCSVFPELMKRPELLSSSEIKATEEIRKQREILVKEARKNREIATHPNNAEQLSGPEPEVEATNNTSEVSAPTAKAGSRERKRYTKELNNALKEQNATNEWITELRRSIADIDQNTDQRSEKIAEDYRTFKGKVVTRQKLSENAPTAELELQRKIHNNLVVPLSEPNFEPTRLRWPKDGENDISIWACWFEGQKSPAATSKIDRFADYWTENIVQANPHARESMDYTKPLLAHANMYALGDYTQIPALQAYAFRALQVVLKAIHPIPKHSLAARGFAMLVQYVYVHVGANDPLRKLVATVAAWNHTSLLLEQEYRCVLEGGGDFVLDLTELLARRLAV